MQELVRLCRTETLPDVATANRMEIEPIHPKSRMLIDQFVRRLSGQDGLLCRRGMQRA
jgi:hypothetical protein